MRAWKPFNRRPKKDNCDCETKETKEKVSEPAANSILLLLVRERREELLQRQEGSSASSTTTTGGGGGGGNGGGSEDRRSGSFRRNPLGRSLSHSDVPVTEKNGNNLTTSAAAIINHPCLQFNSID